MTVETKTPLAEWRAAEKKSQTECAEAVGVRQATWSEWESGAKKPQIKYAIRIARLTKGAVSVESWEPEEAVFVPDEPAEVPEPLVHRERRDTNPDAA